MFYRASYDSKGSGLGLYIVKEAINKLNGQISVHSELGSGTRFDILLPNHIPNFSQKPLQEQKSDEVSVES